MKILNIYFVEYALQTLLRNRFKNIFVFIVLTLMSGFLSAVLLLSHSLQTQLINGLEGMGDIVVQKTKASMPTSMDEKDGDAFLELNGVESVHGRVWGYYYFSQGERYFTILGLDSFEKHYTPLLQKVASQLSFGEKSMFIGQGVAQTLQHWYYTKDFQFITANNTIQKLKIVGVFRQESGLYSDDLMVMPKDIARDILGYSDDEVSDIVVKVANKDEIPIVAKKIENLNPNYHVQTRKDLQTLYTRMFDYKSGFFLAMMSVALLTFMIIVYDRASGVSGETKEEIALLKALGWKVEDVIYVKLYEALIISLSAYVVALLVSYGYVYIFHAKGLVSLFLQTSEVVKIPFMIDYESLLLLFLLSVPLYVAAVIIPAWRVATVDVDEVLR